MKTYFAPVERADEDQLRIEIETTSLNPVVDGLMNTVGGLFAVLNEHLQILAVNSSLLTRLGIGNVGDVLGLRPGEMLHCVHSTEMAAGCGTSRSCSSCGMAIAIVSSLGQKRPMERTCALRYNRQGQPMDLYLQVRSCPIRINERQMLLLFLQDITRQQQWAALERVFFHDVANLLQGLVGSTEQLVEEEEWGQPDSLAGNIHRMAVRLAQEVKLQQCLTREGAGSFHAMVEEVSVHTIMDELSKTFHHHRAARGKQLVVIDDDGNRLLKTDPTLLVRVIGNMVTNALEATRPEGVVRLWPETEAGGVRFCVWNDRVIPQGVAGRIFQRNFSTKNEYGRGLGTYSMKLFGEEFLGGKVGFSSTMEEGTRFHIWIPA